MAASSLAVMSETSSTTTTSLRLVGVGVVAFSSIAWWPAFTLGAWGTVFFPQLLSLWAVATAAFVLVIVSSAVRQRVGWWALALLIPSSGWRSPSNSPPGPVRSSPGSGRWSRSWVHR